MPGGGGGNLTCCTAASAATANNMLHIRQPRRERYEGFPLRGVSEHRNSEGDDKLGSVLRAGGRNQRARVDGVAHDWMVG